MDMQKFGLRCPMNENSVNDPVGLLVVCFVNAVQTVVPDMPGR